MWSMVALTGAATMEPGPVSQQIPEVMYQQGGDLRAVSGLPPRASGCLG